jgi:glycosyltransferase involved in cell wall biosynthesis
MQTMNILFVTHPYPNYVPDLLLHGLRKLLGASVVDYPRKDCIYEGILGLGICPVDQRCPGWFPNDDGLIDRTDIWRKVQSNYFDLMICDLRALPQLTAQLNAWPKQCAIIDGEDHPQPLSPGPYLVFCRETDGSDHAIPLPMALPEEIFNWITMHDGLPKQYSIGFLGSTQNDHRKQLVETLKTYYPDALFQVTEIPNNHNPTPDGRMGRDRYYQQLQQCRMVLSLPGAGNDTFRFWEDAACNAVHLAPRIPLFIPDDFDSNKEIVRFSDIDELIHKIDEIASDHQSSTDLIRCSRQKLVQHHLTTHRAVYFLERVERAFGKKMGSITTLSYGKHTLSASPPTPADANTAATIHLGLVKGENYGWGVCSRYLIEELSKLQSVQVLTEQDGSAGNQHLKGKLVQALTTVEFSPLFEKARADQNFGYTFFEEELNEKSVQNAKKYDLVLSGSTWCRDRMLEKGILNCAVLIQGIDPKLFFPIENQKSRDRFVIFSGGKFELRKGQDLVLRAVKVLQEKYRDIYLMNCWYNLWPQSVRQMANSPYIAFKYHENEPWIDTMQRTYRDNGLDPDRVITLELVPHHKQRELFKQTDIGVFPNRCEGGTNLVLMEYMACAKPVIASNTSGHKDIITKDNALLLNHCKEVNIQNGEGVLVARWQDPSLDELIAQLEYAYHHRDELHKTGRQAGEDLRHFAWKRSAEHLATIISSCP